MVQKEQSDVYIIPSNFAKEGTILSGRVEARNAAEAAILSALLLRVLLMLELGVRGKIYAGIIVILPLAILAVTGVRGESLSSFIWQFFCYLSRRRVLAAPDGQYRLRRNRRLRKQQKRRYRKEKKKEKKKDPGQGGGKHRKRGRRAEKAAEGGKKIRKKGTSGRKAESAGAKAAGTGDAEGGAADCQDPPEGRKKGPEGSPKA